MKAAVTDAAEIKHRAPVVVVQQDFDNGPADHRSDGIADGHQCNTQAAAAQVGELGCDRVRGGEQAADPESRCEPPDFQAR